MSDTFGDGPSGRTVWTIETVKVDAPLMPFWAATVTGTGGDGLAPTILDNPPKFYSRYKERAIDKARDWIDEQVGAGKYAPEKWKAQVTEYDPFSPRNWVDKAAPKRTP